jgi:hypothetical protein
MGARFGEINNSDFNYTELGVIGVTASRFGNWLFCIDVEEFRVLF